MYPACPQSSSGIVRFWSRSASYPRRGFDRTSIDSFYPIPSVPRRHAFRFSSDGMGSTWVHHHPSSEAALVYGTTWDASVQDASIARRAHGADASHPSHHVQSPWMAPPCSSPGPSAPSPSSAHLPGAIPRTQSREKTLEPFTSLSRGTRRNSLLPVPGRREETLHALARMERRNSRFEGRRMSHVAWPRAPSMAVASHPLRAKDEAQEPKRGKKAYVREGRRGEDACTAHGEARRQCRRTSWTCELHVCRTSTTFPPLSRACLRSSSLRLVASRVWMLRRPWLGGVRPLHRPQRASRPRIQRRRRCAVR